MLNGLTLSVESKAIISAPNSINFSTSLNNGVIIMGYLLEILFLIPITGILIFFFYNF